MSPDQSRQILEAIRNFHRKGRTSGAKIYDALVHVRQSENDKPAEAGLSCPVAGHHRKVIREE